MTKIDKTDWDKYYDMPKSKFSTITQEVTLKKLVGLVNSYLPKKDKVKIIELGGGNSCFAEGMFEKLNVSSYSIIDNCEISVEKAAQKKVPIQGYCCDILDDSQMDAIQNKYDVVYSVGLIEHFRGEDIKKIIDAHFKLVDEDGLVIITFPTPTLQYRLIRKVMEMLKVWQFHDEKALKWEDVQQSFEGKGEVLERKINWKLPLTQMIVAIRMKKTKS